MTVFFTNHNWRSNEKAAVLVFMQCWYKAAMSMQLIGDFHWHCWKNALFLITIILTVCKK